MILEFIHQNTDKMLHALNQENEDPRPSIGSTVDFIDDKTPNSYLITGEKFYYVRNNLKLCLSTIQYTVTRL